MVDFNELLNKQRIFFHSDATKSLNYRLCALKSLYTAIKQNENEILDALKKDLNKSNFEGYMTEIGMVLEELRYVIKNLPKWVKPKKIKTPIAQFYSKSFVLYEPFGIALIMSPWNYPFQLCIEPLIGAICAGNCAVVKPSAYAPCVSAVIKKILEKEFKSEYIAVIEGGRSVNSQLLEQKFDYVFFTGSIAVGHLVMESCAKHLTPMTLELGGKSPCIVEKSADLKLAAKRIVFGKFLNSGQTCVAPDYLLVEKSVKQPLLEHIKFYVTEFFGANPLENDDVPKIINQKHFERLNDLIEREKVVIGGKSNSETHVIEPTVMDNVTFESPVMQDEIFGPILPIIIFDNVKDVVETLNNKQKPLALYLFSNDKNVQDKIINSVSFGGGCINDTIIHLATSHMGFGGVGDSGMGSYHGFDSFSTFSHKKSIVKKSNLFDINIRYHPYTDKKFKSLKKFM